MHLVLTPVVTRHIEALSARGHASPLSFQHIRRLHQRIEWPDEILLPRQLDVPRGYHIRFATAHYRPGWICRLLTVRGEDKWPKRPDVDKLMLLTGFKSPIEACFTWADGPMNRQQVNILEPLDGDWSPMRSS